jgi:hypothetical protein
MTMYYLIGCGERAEDVLLLDSVDADNIIHASILFKSRPGYWARKNVVGIAKNTGWKP